MHARLTTRTLALALSGCAVFACSDSGSPGGVPIDPEEARKKDSGVDAAPDVGADSESSRRDGGRDNDGGREGGGIDRDSGKSDATCTPGANSDPPPYGADIDAGPDSSRKSDHEGGAPWTTGYGTTTPSPTCAASYTCSDITQANCTNDCFMQYCRAKEPTVYAGCKALQKEAFKINTPTADSSLAKNKKTSDPASQKPTIKGAVKKAYDKNGVSKQRCGGGNGHEGRDHTQYPPTYSGPIASCEDYVDRKFYTYNRLDQLAASVQEDPRKVLDFLSKDSCTNTGSSYITNCVDKKKFDITKHLTVMDLNGLETQAIDGTTSTYPFGDFNSSYTKNYFVRGLPTKFLRDDNLSGTKQGKYGYDYPRRPLGLDSKCPTCNPVYFDPSALGPGANIDTIGQTSYSTTLATQRELSALLKTAGYTDDDLNLRHSKSKAFVDKINSRRSLVNILNVWATTINAQIAKSGTAPAESWDGYISMYQSLMNTDKNDLFARISEAQQLGCFDDAQKDANGKYTYVPPCDWSPRIFSDSMYDIAKGDAINKAREEVLSACQAVTEMDGSTFSYKKSMYGALKHDWSWYLETARNFDTWFKDIADYAAAQAKDYAKCLAEALTDADPSNSSGQQTADSKTPRRLGRDNSGDKWEGDKKLFGAGFNFIAKHWVDNYAEIQSDKTWTTQPGGTRTTFCKSRVNAETGAYANATLLGANFTLVDMGVGTTIKPSSSSNTSPAPKAYETGRMKLFGKNLWSGAPTGSTAMSDSYEFTLPPDQPILKVPNPNPAMVFTVAGIPVTVAAYAEAGIGFDGSFEKTISSTCAIPPVNLDLSAELTVTPFIYLDAVGEIAIGWEDLAELGIRGHLSLIRFNMPLTAGAKIYQPSTGDTLIEAGAKLNWTLSSLDGNLAFYAELFGEDVTSWAISNPEIMSWNGVTWASGNIWTGKTFKASLPACTNALYNNQKP